MSFRHKMNRKGSKRYFSKTASYTNRRNLKGPSAMMRGGIRL